MSRSEFQLETALTPIECFVNELADDAATSALAPPELRTWGKAMEMLRPKRIAISLKYDLARLMICGEPYDHQAHPWEDCELLLSLRNALVHYRPEVVGLDQGTSTAWGASGNLCPGLQKRGLIPRKREGARTFYTRVATVETAQWAHETACATVGSLLFMIPEGLYGDIMRHGWEYGKPSE